MTDDSSHEPAEQRLAAKDHRRSPEHDPVQRWLVIVLFCVLAVFAASAGSLVWYAQSLGGAPRTSVERQLIVDEVAAREKPDKWENWARLALSYAHARRWADAEEALARGREIRDAAMLDLVEADILRMKGDESAVAAYDVAIASSKKEYEQVVKELLEKKSVDSPPPNVILIQAMKGRALALQQFGRTAEASEQASATLQLDPTDAELRASYGDMLLELGERVEAETQYRSALTYVPDLEAAHAGLKKLGKER